MSADASYDDDHSARNVTPVHSNTMPPNIGYGTHTAKGRTLLIVPTVTRGVNALRRPKTQTSAPGVTPKTNNFESDMASLLPEEFRRDSPPPIPPTSQGTLPKRSVRNPSARNPSISTQDDLTSSVVLPPSDVGLSLSDSPSNMEIQMITTLSASSSESLSHATPPSLSSNPPQSQTRPSYTSLPQRDNEISVAANMSYVKSLTSEASRPPPHTYSIRPQPTLPSQDENQVVGESRPTLDATPAIANLSYDTMRPPRPNVSSASGTVAPSQPPEMSHPLLPSDNLTPSPQSTLPWQDGNQVIGSSGSTLNTTSISPNNKLQGPGAPAKWHWKKRLLNFPEFRRRWSPWIPGWVLWCILAMTLALSLGIPLGFALQGRDFAVQVTDETMEAPVLLAATLVNVDPEEKTMTIDWGVNVAKCTEDPCEDYDIFFDQNLFVSNADVTGSNNLPDKPVFFINGTMFNGFDKTALPFSNVPFFTTKLFLTNGAAKGRQGSGTGKERTLQAYPFDRYLTVISISAKIHKDGFNSSDIRGISIAQAQGVAVGFATIVDPESQNDGEGVTLLIDISRATEVRLYGVVIVLSIWLVTLTLLSATVSAVILGRRIAKEVLVVPVATLFAFTQLRGTLPGAPPGFGAILDFVGVLPCLAILSLCSVLQLAVFLFRDPEVDRKDSVTSKGAKIA